MAARHSRVPACAKSLPDLLAYNGYGPAKRYPWETPEQYRSRRRAQNKMRDEYLKAGVCTLPQRRHGDRRDRQAARPRQGHSLRRL